MRIGMLAIALAVATVGGTGFAESATEGAHREAVYYADAYADHYHVPRELVHAIITQESNWRPEAISKQGAMGIMQLMPATAVRFGVRNPFSIADNIGGGVRYLAELMQQFNGELRLVVAAYYCGSRRLAQQGLSYSHPAVLSYVASVRRLYRTEVAWRPNQVASSDTTGGLQ